VLVSTEAVKMELEGEAVLATTESNPMAMPLDRQACRTLLEALIISWSPVRWQRDGAGGHSFNGRL
jgi:hypothetical protein